MPFPVFPQYISNSNDNKKERNETISFPFRSQSNYVTYMAIPKTHIIIITKKERKKSQTFIPFSKKKKKKKSHYTVPNMHV